MTYEMCMLSSEVLYYDFLETYRKEGWNLAVSRTEVSTYKLDVGLMVAIL
jgi:hypothetical protein